MNRTAAPWLVYRALAVTVGVLAVAALVWFVGPLVAIAGVVPLAGESARRWAVAAVVAAALGWALWRAARAGRINRRLMEGLLAPAAAPGEPGPGAKELALIGERFEQAVGLLKRRRIGEGRSWLGVLGAHPYIYELPWYVIIGAPGAGKTTALANSGLEFPLEAQIGGKMVRGVGGTRNCDWWFTSDAVLIDTAGRYTTQQSDRAADSQAWRGFLDLLVRYRPGRPLNGVLLTLSVADLLQPDAAKRLAHARELRDRIEELHQQLGIRLPLYVLVTKSDLLAGFAEFFSHLDKEGRAQVWGSTFPYDAAQTAVDPLSRLPSELAALERRLHECLIERMRAEKDHDRRAAIYAFPQQWRILHESLLEMLPVVFGDKREDRFPLLRGVYFTSATQEGTPMDRAIGELARSLGLAARVVPAARSTARAYFVTRLLRDVVLREAGLAGTNLRWVRRRQWFAWGAVGATTALVAAAGLVGWVVAGDARARLAGVSERVSVLARDVDKARTAPATDLVAVLPALQSLRALGPRPEPASAWPAWLDVRRNEVDMLAAAGRDAYERLLRDGFLTRIAARLEGRLRAGDREHTDRLYEDLKAYLMLFGGKNFDRTALRAFLVADWEEPAPASIGAADRDALRVHLDHLLASGEVGAPSQADPQVIADARGLVGDVPLAQRVYGRLKQLDPGPEATPFTLESGAGPMAHKVFARASGESLGHGIPGLYTRAVFERSFRQRTQDVLRELAGEQGWVLGTSGVGAMEPGAHARALAEIERRYRADYVRLWSAFVGDLRLVPTATLAASADLANTLGRADSPLKALLRRMVQETSAGDDTAIDPQFDPLRQFAAGPSPPLDAALTLLGKLGAHLGSVDDAIKRQAAPPASDVMRELAAAAQRAPEPVHAMLAQLAQASAGQSFKALREPMGRQLAEVSADCARATTGRYPFTRTSAEEISRVDFAKTFASGGVLDGYFQRNLAPYVDTSLRTWSFVRADGSRGEAGESLPHFQRGQSIRQGFFHDGGRTLGGALDFRLIDLDPAARSFTLDIDGQTLRFARDQKNAQRAYYPGAGDAAARVRLQMTSAAGTASEFVFDGPWALFKLLDRVRVEPGPTPDRLQLAFDVEGRKARVEVRSEAPVNPLGRQDLEQFECPRRL